MNISCTQENLNRGLNIVSRMATTRATLPVLANILIATDKGRLRFSATDLEIGVTTWIGAKIEEEGTLTIPARTLTDFIANNSDKTINLSIKDSTLHLKSDHYEANIKGIEASEFPLIPEIHSTALCELPASTLKEAIVQTVFAATSDETRPVLGGINIKFSKEGLRFAATDSYRLAERSIKGVAGINQNIDIVVPARTIAELARIIENNQTVKIFLNENQILFSTGTTQLISRLIEGSFPSYEQIIPISHQTKAVINTSEFISGLKMASLFARESANNVRLKVNKGNIEIIAISPQVGDNTSKLPAQTEGKDIEIAFNARYIIDALNVVGSTNITLELTDKLSPGIIRPPKEKDYLYVIMPLRVEE